MLDVSELTNGPESFARFLILYDGAVSRAKEAFIPLPGGRGVPFTCLVENHFLTYTPGISPCQLLAGLYALEWQFHRGHRAHGVLSRATRVFTERMAEEL